MWPESKESKKGGEPPKLKTGLTTGCCATACCVAAAYGLFTNRFEPHTVSVSLPARRKSAENQPTGEKQHQKVVELEITGIKLEGKCVTAFTTKDAGDDPDVTHGAVIWVELEKTTYPGIQFVAGRGVGTVTREGLVLAIGEPAINPVPRKMMTDHLNMIAAEFGYSGGFRVKVGIEKGEQLALKTMNPKLGIMGGLSVLGTSGIVRPFSCAAYIASIHQGVDVALANKQTHIAASTGNLSEQAIQNLYGLHEMALIEMGDFVGALLKHIRGRHRKNETVPHTLSLCAGFGKLTKLANGHMDLHSRASSIDFEKLSDWAKQLGANANLLKKIEQANTSIEVLNLCQEQNIELADFVCAQAKHQIMKVIPDHIQVEAFAINRQGEFIGKAGKTS